MHPSRISLQRAWGTIRLQVAEPSLEDVARAAPQLAHFYNEPVNRALLTNTCDFEPADVEAHYRQMWSDRGRPFLLWADREVIGDADLRRLEGGEGEIAILVGPRDRQGQGLGTQFAQMVSAAGFGPLGLHSLFASVRPQNRGSLRMFEKLGFAVDPSPAARRFGEEPDDVCLSLSRDRFQALHPNLRSELGLEG